MEIPSLPDSVLMDEKLLLEWSACVFVSCTVVAVELVGGETVDLLDRAEDVGRAHDLVANKRQQIITPATGVSREHGDAANQRLELVFIKLYIRFFCVVP
jgi:hypothetical protein